MDNGKCDTPLFSSSPLEDSYLDIPSTTSPGIPHLPASFNPFLLDPQFACVPHEPVPFAGVDTTTFFNTSNFHIPPTFPSLPDLRRLNHDWASLSGIYSLWDFLPERTRLLLNTIQVPESVKHRGYLTVYEMLAIKEALSPKDAAMQCNALFSLPNVTPSHMPIQQAPYQSCNRRLAEAQPINAGTSVWPSSSLFNESTTDPLAVTPSDIDHSTSDHIDESLDFEQLIDTSPEIFTLADQPSTPYSANDSHQSTIMHAPNEDFQAIAETELENLVQKSIPENPHPPGSSPKEELQMESDQTRLESLIRCLPLCTVTPGSCAYQKIKSFEFVSLFLGNCYFMSDATSRKDRLSHLKISLADKMLLYEFELPCKIDYKPMPGKTLVRRVVLVEVPFSAITALQCTRVLVQVLIGSRPLILTGYRTESVSGILSGVSGWTSYTGNFDDELYKSSLHTVVMRKPGSGEALRYLLNRHCPRLAELMKLPFPVNQNVPSWPVQTQSIFPSSDILLPSKEAASTETSKKDMILQPAKRRKSKKPPARQCGCRISCRSLRCSCVRSGQPCKILGRDCGCRSTCENPVNSLVALGISAENIQYDRCLLLNIYSYGMTELQQHLQGSYSCPQCSYVFPMHQIVPGIRECPSPLCDAKLYYSWCRGMVNSVTNPAVKHCNFCHTCVSAQFLHCVKCRKCVSRIPSSLQCTICLQPLEISNDQWSTVGLASSENYQETRKVPEPRTPRKRRLDMDKDPLL